MGGFRSWVKSVVDYAKGLGSALSGALLAVVDDDMNIPPDDRAIAHGGHLSREDVLAAWVAGYSFLDWSFLTQDARNVLRSHIADVLRDMDLADPLRRKMVAAGFSLVWMPDASGMTSRNIMATCPECGMELICYPRFDDVPLDILELENAQDSTYEHPLFVGA